MKKMILAVMTALALFLISPTFTEASTNDLNFKAVVYGDETKNEYYSLEFFDYLFALGDIDMDKNKMTHLQFTNDSYYKFFDYLFGITGSTDFQQGLRNVVEKYDAQDLNISPGKVENGLVVSNGPVQVREFKVIDIK